MKIELVQDKTAAEIASIWVEYHKLKEVLVATIPVKTYDLLMQRGKENPIFILPLPRSQGYEFFMTQFDKNNCIHFTSLLCYQVS
jgi:ATP synthase mitochondrial F1 complex assembly factor 1